MAEFPPTEVEILLKVGDTSPQRLIGRDKEGRWLLLEERPDGIRQVSRAVDGELALRTATAVLAGEAAALTWPETPRVLALAIVGIAALQSSPVAAADSPPAGAAPQPATAAGEGPR